MIDLLPEIRAWLAQGEDVAVATVVRVAGSAPRPVGARMIVAGEGRMAGSVSGGCVETTVYEEMRDVLAGGPPRLLHFGITEDMIWDVGLACGGTIDVFVQRLDPGLVAALAQRVEAKERVALAVVVGGETGFGESGIGATALFDEQGSTLWPEPPISNTQSPIPNLQYPISTIQDLLASRTARPAIYETAAGVGVYVEPFLPPPVLLIVGGVHVAIPLTRFAREVGFSVTVVDPREKFANRERFPEADKVLVEWPDEAFGHLEVGRDTYVVLLTHDPKIDEPTLAAALQTGAAYIGAIGSRGTHAARFERMQRWGVTPEALRRVYAPIGLDLGSRKPEETALSIIAEVVAVKNGRCGASLRETAGSIGCG